MYNLTMELVPDSDKCLYEQIYEYIVKEIRDGKLLVGEKLPSTRSLAEYLQVSRSTVDSAYGQLLGEGYIEARPCRGYFVSEMEDVLRIEGQDSDWKEKAGVSLNEGKKMQEEIRYDFSPYGVDMSLFPFSIWKKINRNILSCENDGLFEHGEAQGDMELRATIGRYLHSSRGVECRPEQMIIGAGNDYLLMLLEKILGRDIHIAMENPTYLRAWQIFRSFGYRISTVEMDQNGMMAKQLYRTGAECVYVMPSHQFPAGVVMPIGRRTELLKWTKEGNGRYIIEDDYDSEFRYKGKPIPSLQSSAPNGKVIYIGTFSKAIAPAIRVSYMVLPMELLAVYREKCSFYSCTVSRIDQRILNEFIREGYFERHLNKMRKLYKVKHDVLIEELKPLERDFEILGQDAGLHILLKSKQGLSEREIIDRAAKEKIKVYGMSDHILDGKEDAGTVLIGFGGLSVEEIREGTRLFKEALLS